MQCKRVFFGLAIMVYGQSNHTPQICRSCASFFGALLFYFRFYIWGAFFSKTEISLTLVGYFNNSLHLARKHAQIFSPRTYLCSEKQTAFRKRSSVKTVSFKE